jgi:hypothetical protein
MIMKQAWWRNLIPSLGLLTLAVFLFSGCVDIFGKTADQDMDVLVYPKDSSQVTVKLSGVDYALAIGDTVELENTTPPSTGFLGWDAPTCIYLKNYLGANTVLLATVGYDTHAELASGDKKYSEALIDVLTQMAKYKIKITQAGNTQTFGPDIGIPIQVLNLKEYRIRNGTNVSNPIAMDEKAYKFIEDQKDRTMCFSDPHKIKLTVGGINLAGLVMTDMVITTLEGGAKEDIPTEVPQNTGDAGDAGSTGNAAAPVPVPDKGPVAAADAPKGGCSLLAATSSIPSYLSGASIWGLLFALASLPLARKRR